MWQPFRCQALQYILEQYGLILIFQTLSHRLRPTEVWHKIIYIYIHTHTKYFIFWLATTRPVYCLSFLLSPQPCKTVVWQNTRFVWHEKSSFWRHSPRKHSGKAKMLENTFLNFWRKGEIKAQQQGETSCGIWFYVHWRNMNNQDGRIQACNAWQGVCK